MKEIHPTNPKGIHTKKTEKRGEKKLLGSSNQKCQKIKKESNRGERNDNPKEHKNIS